MLGPLAHLRVLDLTDLRGALAGRLLADLGADVVKIEPPGGDPGRRHGPFAGNVAGADRSLPFLYRNLNKRTLALDLHAASDASQFRSLCDGADILLESYGPNRRQVLDLAPEAVRQRHPRLIHVALTDFGLSGPRAQWHAEPLVAFAGSGALFVSGFPNRPPCTMPGFAAHDCAAVFGVAGALIAVLDRTRTGRGQTIEISAQEAAISGFTPWSIPLADYNRIYPMIPTAPPRAADGNYLVLAVADGWVRILPAGRRHWHGLVALLDRAEAFAAPEWELPLFRMMSHDAIRAVAADALANRTREDVFADARRRNVPLAPINTPDEFVASEQSQARTTFRRAGGVLGDAPVAIAPFRYSRTPLATTPQLPRPCAADEIGWTAQPAAAAGDATAPLLAGIRVVVFGYAVVAPELATILAELGADVIRVESRAGLDLLRQITIEPDTPNRAFTFNDASRGHRSACFDLHQPRGRELALQLCAAADVVVENYRGGALRHVGVTYDAVSARRPDVVWLSSQGFGADGPLADVPAFGPLNASYCGVQWLWNAPDVPYPGGTSLNHPDHIASKLALVAVLAALEHRRRSGEGQYIDMAQTEAAAFLVGEQYLLSSCTGSAPRQRGNADDEAVPHGVYPAAGDDRWIAIAVASDGAWQRLAQCCDWDDDPALATLAGRLTARAAIDQRLAEWTRTRDAATAAATLQAAGVSAMAVLGPDELRADPHLLARQAIVTVEHPEIGPERHIGTPIRMRRDLLATAGAAPLLGADTEDVLVRVLGLSPDEARQLIADGICA